MAGKRWSASSWIPMTAENKIRGLFASSLGVQNGEHTFVDLLKFADDVQPDIGKFVLQQV